MHGEDADLTALHVVGDDGGECRERALGEVLQNERSVVRADLLDLVNQAGRDLLAGPIGDDGDALGRLDGETDANRVACTPGEAQDRRLWKSCAKSEHSKKGTVPFYC